MSVQNGSPRFLNGPAPRRARFSGPHLVTTGVLDRRTKEPARRGPPVFHDRTVSQEDRTVEGLYRSLDAVPPDAIVPVIRTALIETIKATEVALLLADYADLSLEPFDHADQGGHVGGCSQPIDSTLPGACYRRQEVIVEHVDGEEAWRIWAPVTVRSERFGVLDIEMPAAPGPRDRAVAAQIASALGYVLANARRYTDVFERVRRRRRLALAAEMQWELLPVLGYDAAEFRLAGSLEPAYEVGGDNFDYAVDGHRLIVSISDAMGHGLRAALIGTLVVTAMRNSRRGGHGIVEQVQTANDVLCDQFGGESYVTTLVMEIDTLTGHGTAVNAGHPAAWRQGPDAGEQVVLLPDPPLGMFPDTSYSAQAVELERGDRLVLLTDGILDAGPSRGDPLGIERFAALVSDHRRSPPNEFVREVTRAALAHRSGDLLDDATLLCLDWLGPGSGRPFGAADHARR